MKVLIILHGWQSSKEKWQEVKEELEKKGIKVIIPDLPGFKKDNGLKEAWDLDRYLDWFNNFLAKEEKETLELSKGFFLLGHSFGGRMAIKFASQNQLRGLILVSAAGVESRKNLSKLKKKAVSPFIPIIRYFSFLPCYEFFRRAFYKYILRKTDYLKTEGYLKETFKKVVEEDLEPYLPKIKTRTLIIWGEKDKILPVSNAYLINKKIKNSELKVLKGVNHAPYLKKPKLLSKVILNFLNR